MDKILTPLKAIRTKCLDCSGGSPQEVRECSFTDCALHEYRFGHRPKAEAILTPVKAMRAKCIDCCCGDVREPKNCTAEKCPIWGYRTGHRPITPESNFNSFSRGLGGALFQQINQFFSKFFTAEADLSCRLLIQREFVSSIFHRS